MKKLQIKCPGCEAKATATEKLFGKTVKCPKCGTAIQIPLPATTAESLSPTPLQPMAARSPQPVRQSQPSAKPKQDASSKPSRVFLFAGLGIALLLLAAAAVFWVMSSGMLNRGGNNNVAGGSNPSQSGNGNASGSPHPQLRYDYAPQRNYLYEIEIDCLDEKRNPRTATSTMQLEAYVQKSSRYTKSFPLYSNYYGTGIGIPGNQIIVDNQMIANAQSIEVKIGGQLYPARRSNKRLSTGMLALLEFDGPDFKPIRVNPFHDYERYPMVIQRDNDGLLYMRGRINSGTDPTLGPLDERRIQGVFPDEKEPRHRFVF